MNDYRGVTFDRRVEIIEFPSRQNDTRVNHEPNGEDDSYRQDGHVDDDVLVVLCRFESFEFHEICRDIQEIRKKLRRRSSLHQTLVNAQSTSTRRRGIVHLAPTDSKPVIEKDGCLPSPPSMRVRARKGLRRHASSI